MNNIVFKSLLYIFFSFLVMGITIFFYNNNFTVDAFFLTLQYIYHELMGLVLFISQFIYVLSGNNPSNREVVVHTLVCCLLFVTFDIIFIDFDYITLSGNSLGTDLFISRDSLSSSPNFLQSIDLSVITNKIHEWDILEYVVISSFSILLFNLSLLVSVNRIFKFNSFLKFIALLLMFCFNLYLWNYQLNIYILIISFILLITVKERA